MKWLQRQDKVMLSMVSFLLYGLTNSLIREHFNESDPRRMFALLAFAIVVTLLGKQARSKNSFRSFRRPGRDNHLLLLLPLWVLATGNLWGGFRSSYDFLHLLFAAISLFLIGYIEELLFRGFLLDALQNRYNVRIAVLLSSLAFGLGHALNLFFHPISWASILQIPFAIGWGLLLSVLSLVLGNLMTCVLIHGTINVLSLFSVYDPAAETVYMVSVVAAAAIYLRWFMKNSGRFVSLAAA